MDSLPNELLMHVFREYYYLIARSGGGVVERFAPTVNVCKNWEEVRTDYDLLDVVDKTIAGEI